MNLFLKGNGSVSDYLRKLYGELEGEIDSFADEKIVNCDVDEWTEYLTEKYRVEPISFYVDYATRSIQKTQIKRNNPWGHFGDVYGEPQFYMVDGCNIDYKVPFSGDDVLLKCTPSTYIMTSFEIFGFQKPSNTNYGFITIRLSYTNQEMKGFGDNLEEKVNSDFRNQFSSFEKMSGYANDDIRSYNENLTSNVQQLLNKRREKADVFFSFSKALKIPLNLNSSSPNLTPIPLKKPHRANLNEPKPHAQEQQFYIDDSDFENIIKIIHLCGTALEESAKTFNQFNEEALRDYIKGMLSSHYENTVTGETFRRVGKTDIQIQREDKAAFIAECKVWHGIKLFSDAIEQLFCYATWKDTKLSLIIFNKENKNFAGVQQQIQSWLKENCKSCKQWNSNIWDCVKYREDTGRDVRLAVALYDISIKELPNSKKN
ncbi:MAG: hypothetical protein ACLRW5_01415 [Faecalibacterium prausnitzii]